MMTLPRLWNQGGRKWRFSGASASVGSVAASRLRTGASAQDNLSACDHDMMLANNCWIAWNTERIILRGKPVDSCADDHRYFR